MDKKKNENNKENVKELIQDLLKFQRSLKGSPDERNVHSFIRRLVGGYITFEQAMLFLDKTITSINETTYKDATRRKITTKIWKRVREIFLEHYNNKS